MAKLEDSILLSNSDRWSNAYYLAGYAVEMGLKACIARRFVSEAIPDKKFVLAIHTHSLRDLIALAGLKSELRTLEDKDSHFAAYWGIAAQWIPESRYEQTDKFSARLMIDAIKEPNHGVLQWIRNYW